MQTIETSVLIVGGGPTGLALACDLARRDVPFRIIDKAPAYFIGSKGKGLQPRSLEVMDDFGIVDQVIANGKFHIPMRGYDGATVLGEKDMHAARYPTPTTPYASVLITPQWRVEEALRGLLERSGGHVDLATELIHLEQDESGVVATVQGSSGEEQVRCEFLVAADGGKSFVRRFLQVPFEGETREDERMYVGDVRLQGLDRDAWHMWPKHPEGILGLCPLPSTDMFQLQAQVPPGDPEPSFELLQEIVARRTSGMNIRLTEAPWMSLYRVNVRMVSKFRIGRVFLAGDAAHVHTPAGGQGMNTGIQDAYNLGWKLAAVLGGAPSSLLDTYEEERLPVAANVLGLSNKLYKQMTGNDDQLRGDAITLQLGITYKEMSLSKTSGDAKLNLSSGDRAPDATGLDDNGHPVRLFDFFRGPHFTLLRLFPSDSDKAEAPFTHVKVVPVKRALSADDAGARVFVDADGHVATTYGGGNGEYVLVRPDGYIGWIGSQSCLSDLSRFPGLT